MCSTLLADDINLFTYKLSNRRAKDYDEVVSGSTERPIAHLVCTDRAVDYFMRKSRITVGRSSSKRGSADVNMGQSTFISRNHLEIYTTESKFYALVTGKNGIFIDDNFYKKGGSAFELPNSCIIRFPSTEIKIQFDVLLDESPSVEADQSYMCHDPQPAQNSIALRSNSFSDLYSSSNHSLNVVDGGLYPVSEEVISHTDAETGDAKKPLENSYESLNGSVSPEDADVPNQTSSTPAVPTNTSSITTPNEHTKPPYSYAQLIVQAISSQVDRQLTLSGIYNYITKRYPFYRHGDKGWQNSIRHNLSLNRYFVKVPRAQEEAGKGCFWRIDPSSEAVLTNQAFRRRRQRPVPYCKANSFDALHPSLNLSDSSTIIGTPDDSCASWDGAPILNEEGVDVADHHHHHHQAVKHEQTQSQLLPPPTTSTSLSAASSYRCYSTNNNKTAFNALPIATNLFASLPVGLNKSHFIFTKPLVPIPDQLTPPFMQTTPTNNGMSLQDSLLFPGDGMKSNNLPIVTTSSTNDNINNNINNLNNNIMNNNSINNLNINNSLKSKTLLQPYLISSQPKTIILRSNPNNHTMMSYPQGLSLTSSNQYIKLSYAPQSSVNIRSSQVVNGDVPDDRRMKSSLAVVGVDPHQPQQLQQMQQQLHILNRNHSFKMNISSNESKTSLVDEHLIHENATPQQQTSCLITDNSKTVVPTFCN